MPRLRGPRHAVFRGFLLTSLTKWMPTWAALGLSSLAFGLCHLSLRDLPILTALGMLLGSTYIRRWGKGVGTGTSSCCCVQAGGQSASLHADGRCEGHVLPRCKHSGQCSLEDVGMCGAPTKYQCSKAYDL